MFFVSKYIEEGRFSRGVLEVGTTHWTNRRRVQRDSTAHGGSLIVTPCLKKHGENCRKGKHNSSRFLDNYFNSTRMGHGAVHPCDMKGMTVNNMRIGNRPRQGTPKLSHCKSKRLTSECNTLPFTSIEENLLSTGSLQISTRGHLCFETFVQQFYDSTERCEYLLDFNYDDKYVMSFDLDENCRKLSCLKKQQAFAEVAVRNKKGFDKIIQLELYKRILRQYTDSEIIHRDKIYES